MDPQIHELKHRVEAKRKELMSRLEDKKADGMKSVGESQKAIRRKLDDLENSLQEGWDRLSSRSVRRLNEWLESA